MVQLYLDADEATARACSIAICDAAHEDPRLPVQPRLGSQAEAAAAIFAGDWIFDIVLGSVIQDRLQPGLPEGRQRRLDSLSICACSVQGK